jgi:hypothetical protein
VLLCSYLGYGLMAARAKVIEAGKDDPNHPCFAKGSSIKYSYAGGLTHHGLIVLHGWMHDGTLFFAH